jgi:hypothetical protein
VFAIVTVRVDLRFLSAARLSYRMQLDARERRLIIRRVVPKTTNVPAPTDESPDSSPPPANPTAETVEFLPISRLAWTEGGRPVGWRTAHP